MCTKWPANGWPSSAAGCRETGFWREPLASITLPPMTDADRVKLLVGTVLTDEARDKDVVVVGFTDARIPWPVGKAKGGRAKSLVVFGALAEAVRTESNLAVCH
jgi:hypothetical protein